MVDGEVYAYQKKLQEVVNRAELEDGIVIAANSVAGGGDTMNRVFENLTTTHIRNEQKQLCLCIADSDVSEKGKFPKKEKTYGKVKTQQDENEKNLPLVSHAICTTGREAEFT